MDLLQVCYSRLYERNQMDPLRVTGQDSSE